jgi:6-phosphogluconolactonase (cycloisomerase 2 family)
MSRYRRRQVTTSDLLRERLSRRWWLAVATALALAFGAGPAQAAPFAYVANNGSDSVSQYDVGPDGTLSPMSPATVAAGHEPTRPVVSPDGKSVYVTNNGSDSVSQYDIGAGGALSPKSPATVPTGAPPRGVLAVSPDGKSAYVIALGEGGDIDSEPGFVFQYDIGPAGQLSPKTPFAVPANIFPGDITVSPDGRSVYVSGAPPHALGGLSYMGMVLQYDVGPDGTLSPKTPSYVLDHFFLDGMAVSPDGKSVYAAQPSFGGVQQYEVGAGGQLSPTSPYEGVPVGIFPSGPVVSPNGKSVYVAASGGGPPPHFRDRIFQYDVGPDGTLSPKNPPAVTAIDATSLAVSPTGKSVYATNRSDSVSQYDVGAGGALSPKSPATVPAGHYPAGVAVSPLVPTSRERCKRGGWRDFPQFRNEGSCVSFVQKHR